MKVEKFSGDLAGIRQDGSPCEGEGVLGEVSPGCLHERSRKLARTAGRRHRIHHASAENRGLMAARTTSPSLTLRLAWCAWGRLKSETEAVRWGD
jgi:hypothetical protein